MRKALVFWKLKVSHFCTAQPVFPGWKKSFCLALARFRGGCGQAPRIRHGTTRFRLDRCGQAVFGHLRGHASAVRQRGGHRARKGLGVFAGEVPKFDHHKVPQIGWNRLNIRQASPLLNGIPDGSYFYFAQFLL
ncbi:MAG: hypothetical protein R3C26_01010 [Calditrichia bacterium]